MNPTTQEVLAMLDYVPTADYDIILARIQKLAAEAPAVDSDEEKDGDAKC